MKPPLDRFFVYGVRFDFLVKTPPRERDGVLFCLHRKERYSPMTVTCTVRVLARVVSKSIK